MPYIGKFLAQSTAGAFIGVSFERDDLKKLKDLLDMVLDLNGYTFKGESRAFYNDQNASSAAFFSSFATTRMEATALFFAGSISMILNATS